MRIGGHHTPVDDVRSVRQRGKVDLYHLAVPIDMMSCADVDGVSGSVEQANGAERDLDRFGERQRDVCRSSVDDLARLGIARQQFGVGRRHTSASEHSHADPGQNTPRNPAEATHGSAVTGSIAAASVATSSFVAVAPRPVTSSLPTTAAANAKATVTAIRCNTSGAQPASN